MNGELAQRIALVMWGNEIITRTVPAEFLDSHATTNFVRSFLFDPVPRRWPAKPVMRQSVSGWFTDLLDAGTNRLELDALGQLLGGGSEPLDTHLSAAFVNSVPTPIIAQTRKSTVWAATWQVQDGPRPSDSRIWNVHYSLVNHTSLAALTHPSIADGTVRLKAALTEIAHFATANKTGHWIQWFQDALTLLYDHEPVVPYWPDLCPPGDPARSRLLAASVKAFVFGGMGSWNDLGFETDAAQQSYLALTRQLYNAVMFAIDATTNAN
jgi:hypothetical protein